MKRMIFIALALVACQPATINEVLGVQPAAAATTIGGMVQFLAENAAPPVTWAVQEGSIGGTITGGLYSATPCATVVPGTYHVVATAGGKSASATVTVTSEVVTSVTVSPGTLSIPAGGTQQFVATVTTSCASYQATSAVIVQPAAAVRRSQ